MKKLNIYPCKSSDSLRRLVLHKSTFAAIFPDELDVFQRTETSITLSTLRDQASCRSGKVARFYRHFQREK